MKKLLLCATALLSLNCYAAELKLTQVLVEHLDKMPVIKTQTKNSMCTAYAYPGGGMVGTEVIAVGQTSFTIQNTTDTQQNYWVDKYMCINDVGCTHVRDTTSLAPGGIGTGSASIADKEMIKNKGTYIDQATVQITGESTCFVQSSNYIDVH